jgi:ketosteroid isomerase-like protein
MDQLFERMVARDLDGMLALFADDAVLYDPHYPVPTMEGKAAIKRGLTWGLETLAEPGFTVRQVFVEGNGGVVEVHTHHVLSNGMKLDFEQVFLFETRGDHIVRLRAFVPYRAPGIGGWIPRVTALWWRLRG